MFPSVVAAVPAAIYFGSERPSLQFRVATPQREERYEY